MNLSKTMTDVTRHRWFNRTTIALLFTSMNAIALLSSIAAVAQIIPDRTLGSEQSTLNPNVTINNRNSDLIEGGARRGANLFHSFEQFNIKDGQRLYFANPAGVINIISRVTGSDRSNILGTLGVQGNAHLFLLNPNGLVFGQNARLDVRGSFVATTASSVRFADGTEFKATEATTNPLLTVSVPIGLQFGTNPGSIRVQGNGQGFRSGDAPEIDTNDALRVLSNQTLALVGGSIFLTGGTLKTAGGRLELGSVLGTGFVKLTPSQKGFVLSYDNQTAWGDIQLLGATSIDASGRSGGEIQVQARRVILQGGSAIEATTLGNADGGTIKVTASEEVELSGSTADNPQDLRQFVTSISADNRGAGKNQGELTVNTARLTIRNGARMSASNTRAGVGGNININATDRVELVSTGISPGGRRSSGISVQTRGIGRAGDIRITTRQLLIREGAEVSASTFGAGYGGNINIQAAERVDLLGTSPDGALRSRFVAEVGNPNEIRRRNDPTPITAATGRGGDINVTTNKLTVQEGATISVSSRSPIGQAGNLNITANAIVLDQGRLTAETGVGSGADINLRGLDLLLLKNKSLISAQAFANATGGNVTVNAEDGFVVAVPNRNNDIIAIASQGRGGNISITAQGIFGIEQRRVSSQNQTNDIDASSEFNQSGTVTLNQPDIDPTQGLAELPSEPRTPQPLASCQPGDAKSDRFIATGSGGLPTHPDDPLSSLASLDDLPLPAQWLNSLREAPKDRAAIPPQATPSEIALIEEAQGWIINQKGEVILVAGQPSKSPCSSEPSRN
jgi:filamentous hemagglutinin family protein